MRFDPQSWHGSRGSCTHAGAPIRFEHGKAYIVCPACGRRERLYMSGDELEREVGAAAQSGNAAR